MKSATLKFNPVVPTESNFIFTIIICCQQECIPAGCVPPTRYRTKGGRGRGLPNRDPLDRDLPWTETLPLDREPPWTETPLGQRSTWTETPQTETPRQRPPGQRPPWTEITLDRDHPGQRPPWTETPWIKTPPWTETPVHVTCGAWWDRDPPLNRITDTCKNITLPQLRCGR